MSVTFLKRATKTAATGEADIRASVEAMLAGIELGGEAKVRELAAKLDGFTGDILVSDAAMAAAEASVPKKLRDDIHAAHDNVRRFAEAQRAAIHDVDIEIAPGLLAGHRNLPLASAGCYAPGGRYAHIASAIMSVTTAKVAGVRHIVACSPPRSNLGMHPASLYALRVCGADRVLNLGGVQAVAAMAFGLFGNPPVDGLLVGIRLGPLQFLAEAILRRLLDRAETPIGAEAGAATQCRRSQGGERKAHAMTDR